MNFGLRNRQISIDAVPAISTFPEIEPIRRSSVTAGSAVGPSAVTRR
jgi:hypothetical protein